MCSPDLGANNMPIAIPHPNPAKKLSIASPQNTPLLSGLSFERSILRLDTLRECTRDATGQALAFHKVKRCVRLLTRSNDEEFAGGEPESRSARAEEKRMQARLIFTAELRAAGSNVEDIESALRLGIDQNDADIAAGLRYRGREVV